MKAFQPYLNFDGETREVMTFYHQCLGGDLMMQTFGESGMPCPPGYENRIVHARITKNGAVLMASDIMPGAVPGATFTKGSNFQVNVDCESLEEIERLFNALGQGGTVTMPLGDQFWGARFGMLTDKFGQRWMFNCELKKQ